jgi:DNA-binding response OmpR family regulator
MADTHLFVVDDEPAVTVLLEHACARWEYRITVARSLAEARVTRPPLKTLSIALLDIGLPDGSGLSLLEEIRSAPDGRDLPAVILTGAGDDKLIREARMLGAAVVTKPFSLKKLHRLIEDLTSTLPPTELLP